MAARRAVGAGLLDGARAALGDEDSALKASLLAQLAVNFHSEDELSRLSAEGRLGDAERLAGEAFTRHRRANPSGALPAHTAHLCFLRHEQGRLAEMEPLVRRWAAEQPQTPLWQALLLLLLASSGRTAEASELLARLAADGVLGYGDNGPFPLTPDQVTPVALLEGCLADAGRSA